MTANDDIVTASADVSSTSRHYPVLISPHPLPPPSVKPHIDRANMVMVTIKVNKSHKFAVNVRGEPPPTLTWFNSSGDEIKPTDRIKVRQ